MESSHRHRIKAPLLKSGLKNTLLFAVLFVYLIIPFKQQFLDSVHLLSHVAVYEETPYSHDHLDVEVNHDHTYLTFLAKALDGTDSEHPIPVELLNYEFQMPILTEGFQLVENFPLISDKTFSFLFIPILTGPFFEVPHPPP